jgi:hypothetical protein
MGVKIDSLGIVVKGAVTRKFNGSETTLTVTAEQARELYDALGTVVQFFEGSTETVVDAT